MRPENPAAGSEWVHYRIFVIKELERLSDVAEKLLERIEECEREVLALKRQQPEWYKVLSAAAGAGGAVTGLIKLAEILFHK